MDKTQIYIANMLGASYASLGRKYGISAKRIKRVCSAVASDDQFNWFVDMTLRHYTTVIADDIAANNRLVRKLIA